VEGASKKLLFALIFALAAAPALAAGIPHTSYGTVKGSEADTSCTWTFYVVSRPSETLKGNLKKSGTSYFWQALVGNLKTAWSTGEASMVIAAKEKNSASINHTAYYAVMNEDLSNEFPQLYNECTLREVPVPNVAATSNAVALAWTAAQTDPSETPHGNNIIGYNIYRGQDGKSFVKVNTSLVSGTSYTDNKANSDPDPVENTSYYYALEPVFKGNMALGYYSSNSNPVTFPAQSQQKADVKLNLKHTTTTGNLFWISLPYITNFIKSSDIISKINADHSLAATAGDKITQVGRWDPSTQAYETYDYLGILGWSGIDFSIVTGEAVFLNIASDVSATLPGYYDPNFAFNLTHNTSKGNIFWISLPQNGKFTNAVSIVADINSNAGLASDSGKLVTQTGHWKSSAQAYETYDYLGILGWSGINFNFVSGEGYLINLAGDIKNWKPSTN
jgi:hypothetical protein